MQFVVTTNEGIVMGRIRNVERLIAGTPTVQKRLILLLRKIIKDGVEFDQGKKTR